MRLGLFLTLWPDIFRSSTWSVCLDVTPFFIIIYGLLTLLITADVGYVPNAKYLAHIPHKTLKTHFIRCAKPKKFYNIWIVPLQICNGTDEEWYNFYCFFILFSLSSLVSLFFSLLSHLSFLSPLFSLLCSLRRMI